MAQVPTPSELITRLSATRMRTDLLVSRCVNRDLSRIQCIVAPESTTERGFRFLVDRELLGDLPVTFMHVEGGAVGATGHVGGPGIGNGTSLVNMHEAIKTERKSGVLISLVIRKSLLRMLPRAESDGRRGLIR